MIWEMRGVMLVKDLILCGLALFSFLSLMRHRQSGRTSWGAWADRGLAVLLGALTTVIVWPLFPMGVNDLLLAHAVWADLLLMAAAFRTRGFIRIFVLVVLAAVVGVQLLWGLFPGAGL